MQALPTKLDTAQALSLATEIKADLEQNSWIHLNGKSVEMVGQACLQILLSARFTAEKAGLPFLIEDPSEALRYGARLLGIESLLFVPLT
ncbi:chemotaxis protein CheX [Zymomonas sp.]|uniref:chemotaxis protein CheX n=1 Tax=Zymomonas sp. TaxID=2068624 RepID=UPI0025EBE6E3|nr:chemotaxis protein CheX [Zymomonas sp.]MCA1956295.1 chemotaxis protein CheX [Zymomonas sp.]